MWSELGIYMFSGSCVTGLNWFVNICWWMWRARLVSREGLYPRSLLARQVLRNSGNEFECINETGSWDTCTVLLRILQIFILKPVFMKIFLLALPFQLSPRPHASTVKCQCSVIQNAVTNISSFSWHLKSPRHYNLSKVELSCKPLPSRLAWWLFGGYSSCSSRTPCWQL